MDRYQSRHIMTLFDISHQTVRVWAQEFERHLSAGANPATGQHRFFSYDDLQVFALIAQMRNEGESYDAIKAALASGARGQLPETAQDDVLLDITSTDAGARLLGQLETLINKVQKLEQDMMILRDYETSQLQTEVEKLQSELTGEREKINMLNREIGKLEALLTIERNKNKSSDDND